MRKLKRLLPGLLVVAMAAIALGAAPGSASAASCSSITFGATYWNGLLNANMTFSGCTDVAAIQVDQPNSGWNDLTWGTSINSTGGVQNIPCLGSCSQTFTPAVQHPAWCGGMTHAVTKFGRWRLKSLATGIFTGWSIKTSVAENIVC